MEPKQPASQDAHTTALSATTASVLVQDEASFPDQSVSSSSASSSSSSGSFTPSASASSSVPLAGPSSSSSSPASAPSTQPPSPQISTILSSIRDSTELLSFINQAKQCLEQAAPQQKLFMQDDRFVMCDTKEDQQLLSVADLYDPAQLAKLVNCSHLADKRVRVGDRWYLVYVHSEIVSRRSEYFKAMFTSGFKESLHTEQEIHINLPYPQHDIFLAILHFLYTGDIPADHMPDWMAENAGKLLRNADFLQIPSLPPTVLDFFATSPDAFEAAICIDPTLYSYPFFRAVLEGVGSTKPPLWKLEVILKWVSGSPQHQADAQALIHKHVPDDTLSYDALRSVCDADGFDAAPASTVMHVCGAQVDQLQRQLEVVKCNRCGKTAVRAQFRLQPCVNRVHTGSYECNQGWTCCKRFFKKSEGCSGGEHDI